MKNTNVHLATVNSNIMSDIILLFLLSVRLIDYYLADWIFPSEPPYWFNFFYIFSLYILTMFLLWLNKNDLANMNIDSSFVEYVLFGGVLLFFYISPELGMTSIVVLGVILGAIMICFYLQTRNIGLVESKNNKRPLWFWMLMVGIIGLAWLPIFLYQPTLRPILSVDAVFPTFFQAFFQANLPAIVFEEILFRGALVGFLRRYGFREYSILIIPAILFWISHHKYILLNNTYSFWVSVPLLSLLFGIVSLKSKSLVPSTIAHFLFNFTTSIILIIYS